MEEKHNTRDRIGKWVLEQAFSNVMLIIQHDVNLLHAYKG